MVVQAGAGPADRRASTRTLTGEAFEAIAGAARQAEQDRAVARRAAGGGGGHRPSPPTCTLVEELVARAAGSGLDVAAVARGRRCEGLPAVGVAEVALPDRAGEPDQRPALRGGRGRAGPSSAASSDGPWSLRRSTRSGGVAEPGPDRAAARATVCGACASASAPVAASSRSGPTVRRWLARGGADPVRHGRRGGRRRLTGTARAWPGARSSPSSSRSPSPWRRPTPARAPAPSATCRPPRSASRRPRERVCCASRRPSRTPPAPATSSWPISSAPSCSASTAGAPGWASWAATPTRDRPGASASSGGWPPTGRATSTCSTPRTIACRLSRRPPGAGWPRGGARARARGSSAWATTPAPAGIGDRPAHRRRRAGGLRRRPVQPPRPGLPPGSGTPPGDAGHPVLPAGARTGRRGRRARRRRCAGARTATARRARAPTRSTTSASTTRRASPSTPRSGHVLVADDDNHRVVEFLPDGTYVRQIGSYGVGAGQFRFPYHVGIDAREPRQLDVADNNNHRVQAFDFATLAFQRTWGQFGTEVGDFGFTRALAAVADDPAGGVAVADTANDRVQTFAPDGAPTAAWGIAGRGPGYVTRPEGVAVDAAGTSTWPTRSITASSASAPTAPISGRRATSRPTPAMRRPTPARPVRHPGRHRRRPGGGTRLGGRHGQLPRAGARSRRDLAGHPTGFSAPRELAVAPDGAVYVADTGTAASSAAIPPAARGRPSRPASPRRPAWRRPATGVRRRHRQQPDPAHRRRRHHDAAGAPRRPERADRPGRGGRRGLRRRHGRQPRPALQRGRGHVGRDRDRRDGRRAVHRAARARARRRRETLSWPTRATTACSASP